MQAAAVASARPAEANYRDGAGRHARCGPCGETASGCNGATRSAVRVAGVFSPLDEELGLVAGNLSPGLVETIAELGTWMPFGRVRTMLARVSGAHVSEATARRATLAAGEALVALEEDAVTYLEEALPDSPAGAPWQQVSVDGAMVPLVRGEWGEARTLALGTLTCEEGDLRARELSYFSRMTDHLTFSRLATVETYRRGLDRAETVLAVNDGAEWIQDLVDVHAPGAVRILDWAHASGYIHAAGHAVFPGACGDWCAGQLRTLLAGEPIDVLVELARLEDGLDEAHPGRPAVAQALAYLAKRHEQVQYARFRKEGYPIGSGIVESANKVVVEARLKGAGMHWSRTSVNPMLALRSISCSNRWDATWPHIIAQLRGGAVLSRRRRHDERQSRMRPAPPRRQRPPRTIGGRPTSHHPWKRYPAVPPRHAKL